jgi:hypothetical protein|eukprot:Stramenopile-MAST_4_protein_4489
MKITKHLFLLLLAVLFVSSGQLFAFADETTTEDEEDMNEVEAIVNQTDVIKMIVSQKQRHAESLREMDEKIELEIMSFYDKHDEALSEFRDIDHNLRDRINILEERVLSEVKGLSANKPNRWSWLVPFCILMTLLGAFAAYSRRKLKTLKSGL